MKSAIALVNELLSILPTSARRYLIVYSILLGLLSVLDAFALGLLALVISPILSGATLTLPVIGEVGEVGLLLMLGLVCVMIIAKGVFAVGLLWGATRRFAKYELQIGSRLFDSYIDSPWVERLKRNSSDVVRLTDGSVGVTISGFLLPFSTLFGEALSFITVVAVLAIVQPLVAGIALGYLGLLGALLFFWVTKRAREAGRVNLKYTLKTSRLITEMIGALKEVTLRGKATEVAGVVRSNRIHSTRARSNIQFLNQVPRYVLESGIIGGFVLVGIAGYATGGITEAITAVALFGLAGFRMAPSVVRFQSVVSQVTSSTPHARAVLAEIRRSEDSVKFRAGRETLELPDSQRALSFENVSFRYSADQDNAIRDVSFTIPFGSTVALVGASGAGKSTVVDLILGLIEPTAGRLAIDEVDLTKLTAAWRKQVGYVPQDVALFDSTIAQNVALTWGDDFDEDRVRAALKQAQLLDIVESRDGGIHGAVGERGLTLSGGQRQRLGIARALYPDPLVLVMDEATSALDTATEASVTEAIKSLHGSKTVITVAHRLSTVQHADQVFFMSQGKVAAQGTFSELVAEVPEFARQAGLAGLA